MPDFDAHRPGGRVTPTPADLFGRDRDLALLDDLFVRASGGDGDAIAIAGDMGIGKTSLLRAGRTAAESRGLRVLHARGTELERPYAYGAVRQLLDAPLREVRADEHVWDGPALLARPIFDDLSADHAAELDGALFARRQGLYWLVVNLLERLGPIALVVDDAQWVDDLSVHFLHHLSLRLDGLPLALVIGTRPASTIPSDAPLQDVLLGVPLLSLAPLDAADVTRFIQETWGPATAELGVACHALTGGVPLLTRELVEELRRRTDQPSMEALPPGQRGVGVRTIAARVQRELRGAGPAPLALAQAVAILGDDVPLDLGLDLAGIDASEAEAALAPLLLGGLLTEASGRLSFVHAVVQDSVTASLSAPERASLHRRAAELLHHTSPGDRRIAGHLLETPPRGDAWALVALRDAAARATALGASDEAARLLERALQETDTPTAAQEWELGRALAHAGRDGSLERYDRALALAAPGLERLRIVQDVTTALVMANKTDGAFALLADELGQLPGPMAPDTAGALHTLAMFARSERATAFRAKQVAEQPDDPAPVQAAVLAYEAMLTVPFDPRLDHLLDRAFGADGFPPEHAASGAFSYGVLAMIFTDRFDQAFFELDRQARAARASGAFMLEGVIDQLRAFALAQSGRLPEAEAAALASMTYAEGPASRFARVAATTLLAGILPELGRTSEARQRIDLIPPSDLSTDSNLTDLFTLGAAKLLIAEGNPAGAVDRLTAAGDRMQRWGATNPGVFPWRSTLSGALAALGDHARAVELAREELRLAELTGVASAIATAQIALGTADVDHDSSVLEAAVEHARRARTGRIETRALLALGKAQRVSGDLVTARATLREALAAAERVGASQLAADALTEISAAGGRPRAGSTAGAGALTSSEVRVARLASEGDTNREIAQRLYLSQKTVEMHLRNVYRKLDVPGRAHLASQLRDAEELREPAT